MRQRDAHVACIASSDWRPFAWHRIMLCHIGRGQRCPVAHALTLLIPSQKSDRAERQASSQLPCSSLLADSDAFPPGWLKARIAGPNEEGCMLTSHHALHSLISFLFRMCEKAVQGIRAMNSGAGTSATGLAVQGACHPALAAMRYPLHRPANRSNGIQQTRLYQAAPARICLAMPMSARPCFCMATFDSRPCSRERCAARWCIRPRTRA